MRAGGVCVRSLGEARPCLCSKHLFLLSCRRCSWMNRSINISGAAFGALRREAFPAAMVCSTQASQDGGARADGGEVGEVGRGLFALPREASQFRNKLGARQSATDTGSWRSSTECLHFLSQGGGGGCQNRRFLLFASLGLAIAPGDNAGGSASLPSIFPRARHFIGSQLLLAVTHVLWPIIQMRKPSLGERK